MTYLIAGILKVEFEKPYLLSGPRGVLMGLEVKDLSFKYEKEILKDICLKLEKGSFCALLGINGSGKSTLLKNIVNILKPYKGCVYYDGKDIKDYRRRELAQTMSYVAQNEAVQKVRVYDSILIGRKPYIKYFPTEDDHKIVCEIMEYLGLQEFALRYTDELSGGEAQKVLIARALAQEPEVLLLDEPTSALDLKNQLDVMDMVKKYCEHNNIMTIISIHDINLSLRYATDFILLKDKEIFKYGGLELITPENISEVYQIDLKIYELDGGMFVVPIRQLNEAADSERRVG